MAHSPGEGVGGATIRIIFIFLRSRWTLSRSHLPSLYEKIRSRIINQLEEAKYISITTDTWDGDCNTNNTTKKETSDHTLLSVTGKCLCIKIRILLKHLFI